MSDENEEEFGGVPLSSIERAKESPMRIEILQFMALQHGVNVALYSLIMGLYTKQTIDRSDVETLDAALEEFQSFLRLSIPSMSRSDG